MDTQNLQRQHHDQESIIDKIIFYDSVDKIIKNANQIAVLINQLTGKLKVHSIAEDQFLYPDLLKSEDKKIKAKAEEFFDEMKKIGESYNVFKDKYKIATTIEKSPIDFLNESKIILISLKKRISKENGELYPLIKNF